MKAYYIRHKIKTGDITHLSDSDSEIILSKKIHKEEDLIYADSPSGRFVAMIVFIDQASVEVEILRKESNVIHSENTEGRLILIQSIMKEVKFNFFLEKAVELGVDEIIPIESYYSQIDIKKANSRAKIWEKVIKEAAKQSRTKTHTSINSAIKINSLKSETSITNNDDAIKLCLATESIKTKSLEDIDLGSLNETNDIIIAIGPESGWHSTDLEIFDTLGFENVIMKGNILRTETAGLVITSIIKFMQKKL